MFIYSLFKKKEIPDELKAIVPVIDTKTNYIREIQDGIKFLLAEKNCVPIYASIPASKLVNANDERICFYDVEELLKLTPRGIENKTEGGVSKYNLNGLMSIISSTIQWDKLKEIMKISPSDGMTLLSNEEIQQKEIKKIAVSALGQKVALVSRHNTILLVRMEAEGRLI